MTTNNAWNSQDPAQVALGGTGAATLTGVLLGSGTSAITGLTGNSKVIASNSSGTFAGRSFSIVQTVFTITGNYPPTPGMLYCEVICVGGGAGGGGGAITGGGQFTAGSGGGSASWAIGIFSAATIGAFQSFVIGDQGFGVSGSNGSDGRTTTFGALISCPGGSGGLVQAASGSGTFIITQGGAGGAAPTGGNYGSAGQRGQISFASGNGAFGGSGGSSPFGTGGIFYTGAIAGITASGYGCGGGGVYNVGPSAALTGGDGFPGVVIVTEYVIA